MKYCADITEQCRNASPTMLPIFTLEMLLNIKLNDYALALKVHSFELTAVTNKFRRFRANNARQPKTLNSVERI